jgi:hypothetical protein
MLSLFVIGLLNTAVAGVKSEEPYLGFKIIEDTTDASVDPGKCKVMGKVLFEGELISNALVYSQNTRGVKSNKKGEFEIIIDTIDKYITVDIGKNRLGYIEGYDFKGGHRITCEVFVHDITIIDVCDKPVIYLYSEEELNAEIGLKTTMDLSFIYPSFSHETTWEVTVSEQGISTSTGKYPYLFWEAKTENLAYMEEEEIIVGDFVKTDTLISYLEHTLAKIGLNSTEQADFITYWGPRMSQYNYVIAQFNIDDYVSYLAQLEVTPQPEAQLRLFMLFTGFETNPNIDVVPNYLGVKPFERDGFTLLEWGGSEISKEKLFKIL